MAAPRRETVLLRPASGAARPCPLEWRASPRARRITLRLDPVSGHAVLTLPAGLSAGAGRRAGLALLRRHADWMALRLAALGPPLRLAHGAVVPLADAPHAVLHRPLAAPVAVLRPGRILVGGAAEGLAGQVLALLRQEAGRRIALHVRRHAGALGVAPRAIRLKDPRSRWASCTAGGVLAFSWRLVMAPDWVLASVAAHEVAHLREMNHSPRFWAALAGLSPDHAAAQAWLRQHGPRLLRVGA
ncbi:M48 family metallopeptidase [Roseomonas sp. KE0001]|uniref:M48 family metallopeptidase n=1 Tax=Roseomonas sp. KE0001 TaxID=2479201 RepID=UPI0018DF0C7E|nr:M48 family metallopeptidase [Roseomonas sp. KE0001]MBI0433785.1 M48 family peptidase [Roseomonas sp. KE0001]